MSLADYSVRAATAGDYFALLKPRVMSLVVFTGLVGYAVAPGAGDWILGFASILAIALAAGAAGALNMWFDADIDAVMTRTRTRPIPAGRVAGEEALALGIVMSVISTLIMLLAANVLAAALLAFTIFFYAVVYTMWLKRSTPQNIVIGGLAGALPPAIAWAAKAGTLALDPLLLVAIIFFWTPPHFWALSLIQAEDYKAAKVPMLPVTHGAVETRRQILIYSLLLAPLGLAPVATGLGGWTYAAIAGAGGIAFVFFAARVARSDDLKHARALFAFSILYLFALFAALLIERLIA
ncbi:MAG: heme o synthase [Hyphomonadaceae bacterium]